MRLGIKEVVFFVKAKRFVEVVRDGRLTQELFDELGDAYDDAEHEILQQIERRVEMTKVPQHLKELFKIEITVEEAQFALQAAHAAATGVSGDRSFPVDLNDPPIGDEGSYITPKNIPVNRAMFALMGCFPGDPMKGQAVFWRSTALYQLLQDDTRFAEFQRTDDAGVLELHPALMQAAFTVRLTKKGEMKPKRLLKEIERHLAQMEGDAE